MKKLIVFALLMVGIAGTTMSYAQDDKKTDKKENKMSKKANKGKEKKVMKKENKMEKKEMKDK